MKYIFSKKSSILIVLLISAAILMMPVAADVAAAKANVLPQVDAAQACADAELQAQQDVNGTEWLLIGCLIGVWGYLIAIILDPTPPASAIVGKSPEYVAEYTDCYIKKVKQLRSKNALYGCLVSRGAFLLSYFLLIATLSTASTIE